MSTLTAETFPLYGRENDWFEALSKTDHDSWLRTRGRRTFALISSTARVAEEDIVWASNAPFVDVLWSSDIAWVPEIWSSDLIARNLGELLTGRVATRHVSWASGAPSLGIPFSADITWVPEIESSGLIGRISAGPLTGRVAARQFIVNIGNATPIRRYLEKQASPIGVEVVSRVQELFLRAEDELAETGSAENFRFRLQAIIREAGVPAVDAIARAVQHRGHSDSVVFEVLRHAGMLEHPPSYRRRFDLLVEGLNSPSPTVRDGAGLGLAFLDDPAAIPRLEQAIRKERVRDLKDDLQLVLDQLVETARSANST